MKHEYELFWHTFFHTWSMPIIYARKTFYEYWQQSCWTYGIHISFIYIFGGITVTVDILCGNSPTLLHFSNLRGHKSDNHPLEV